MSRCLVTKTLSFESRVGWYEEDSLTFVATRGCSWFALPGAHKSSQTTHENLVTPMFFLLSMRCSMSLGLLLMDCNWLEIDFKIFSSHLNLEISFFKHPDFCFFLENLVIWPPWTWISTCQQLSGAALFRRSLCSPTQCASWPTIQQPSGSENQPGAQGEQIRCCEWSVSTRDTLLSLWCWRPRFPDAFISYTVASLQGFGYNTICTGVSCFFFPKFLLVQFTNKQMPRFFGVDRWVLTGMYTHALLNPMRMRSFPITAGDPLPVLPVTVVPSLLLSPLRKHFCLFHPRPVLPARGTACKCGIHCVDLHTV